MFRKGDGDKKARSPGRARSKPLKPLRAGMPGCPGELVVTNSCGFNFSTRGCGCIAHPAFPTPCSGGNFTYNPDAFASRERGGVCVNSVIASHRVARMRARWQAPRSNPSFILAAPWIASLALAMTILIVAFWLFEICIVRFERAPHSSSRRTQGPIRRVICFGRCCLRTFVQPLRPWLWVLADDDDSFSGLPGRSM
jgi:hypothetical protein